MWVLEIIQIDASRQFFCCELRSRHFPSLFSHFNNEVPSRHGRIPAPAAQMTTGCAASTSRATSDAAVPAAATALPLRIFLPGFLWFHAPRPAATCAAFRKFAPPCVHRQASGFGRVGLAEKAAFLRSKIREAEQSCPARKERNPPSLPNLR